MSALSEILQRQIIVNNFSLKHLVRVLCAIEGYFCLAVNFLLTNNPQKIE